MTTSRIEPPHAGEEIQGPFRAYAGGDPYIFVSYAHDESDLVFPAILWLHEQGYRIWYDQGIPAGAWDWKEVVLEKVDTCAFFLVFLSKWAVSRKEVLEEIEWAAKYTKPVIGIYLDPMKDVEIPQVIRWEDKEKPPRQHEWKPSRRKLSLYLERGQNVEAAKLSRSAYLQQVVQGWITERWADKLKEARPEPRAAGTVLLREPPPTICPGPDTEEMVLIPAGAFLMGSESGEADEKPVHEVHLDGFYMDRHPVTNRRYRAFVSATGHPSPSSWEESEFKGEDQPVVGVTWSDAEAFCAWAGKRLPTEAEWEKASRGGLVGKTYPWGDDPPEGRACFGRRDSGPDPVGRYAPNGYGLFDAAGGVWEWCSDRYAKSYYGASPKRNPEGTTPGASRVVRGGSWTNVTHYLRCAFRYSLGPADSRVGYGFRCARGLSQ